MNQPNATTQGHELYAKPANEVARTILATFQKVEETPSGDVDQLQKLAQEFYDLEHELVAALGGTLNPDNMPNEMRFLYLLVLIAAQ